MKRETNQCKHASLLTNPLKLNRNYILQVMPIINMRNYYRGYRIQCYHCVIPIALHLMKLVYILFSQTDNPTISAQYLVGSNGFFILCDMLSLEESQNNFITVLFAARPSSSKKNTPMMHRSVMCIKRLYIDI